MMVRTQGIVLILLLCGAYCSERNFLNPLLLSQLKARTGDRIDDGLQLLELLLQSAEADLASANVTDDGAEQHLEEVQAEQEKVVDEKEDECIDVDDLLALQETELKRIQPDLDWIQARIQADRNRIEILKDLKCTSNNDWLNFIKSSNQILKFIQFLRISIQNYKSFSQIKSLIPALERLQSESEMDMTSILAQLKAEANQDEQPSDESILTNWSSVSNARDIGSVKQSLLDLLDQIERSILAKINTSQTNEILTSLRTADFIAQLEYEIIYLLKSQSTLSEVLGEDPTQTVIDQKETSGVCRDELKVETQKLDKIEKQLSDLQDSDSGSLGRLTRIRDVIQDLTLKYREGIYQLAKDNGLNFEQQDNQSGADANSNVYHRQLTHNFADKSANFDEYINAIVKGQVAAVLLPEEQVDGVWGNPTAAPIVGANGDGLPPQEVLDDVWGPGGPTLDGANGDGLPPAGLDEESEEEEDSIPIDGADGAGLPPVQVEEEEETHIVGANGAGLPPQHADPAPGSEEEAEEEESEEPASSEYHSKLQEVVADDDAFEPEPYVEGDQDADNLWG